MKLYIDKANLLSLLGSDKNEKFYSTLKLIKGNLDIGFNFQKEEIRSEEAIVKYLTQLTTGRNSELKVGFASSPVPSRPLTDNYLSSVFQNDRCVLLVDDDNVSSIQKKQEVLIGAVGEEITTLEKLMTNCEDYRLDKELSIGSSDFNSWSSLAKYSHPFYDVIILDRYILKVDEATFKKNLIELLSHFHQDKNCKINIVLFTLKQPTYTWNFAKIKKLISDVVLLKTGHAPNFTLIWSNDQNKARHDRHIMTNYYWLKSGDSFNYFLATTGALKTTGDTLNIKSLASEDYRKAVKRILEKTQEKINELIAVNSAFIEGDKVSSFLKFTL
jgi:hypothetical protein